jgi:hypothetical protein
MQSSDFYIILFFTAVPLLVAAAAGFLGWLYRRLMWPPLRREAASAASDVPADGQPLAVTVAYAVTPAPPGSAASQARDEADRVTTDVRRAHVGAWIVYAAIVAWVFIGYTNVRFKWASRSAIAYAVMAPQLLILLWELRLSYRRRLFLFVVYATIGVTLLLLLTKPSTARSIVASITGPLALFPVGGLLILFIRRIQPFLNLLMAAVTHFMVLGFLLDRLRYSATTGSKETVLADPMLVLLGLITIVLGAVVAWFLLRQRWQVRALAIGAGAFAAVLLDRDVTRQNLPMLVRSLCFLAVAVLQILILWSLFKFFVWLQERGALTNELIQTHVCWAFLTIYFAATTVSAAFYDRPAVVRWGVVIALALHTLALHILLARIRKRRPREPRKRLLLLRPFGRPHEHEDLLDDLNDTWRRIGAVDLLAASDVASRTLESRMLEAFLLRRADDQFVRTAAEVEERIARLRSRIEADVRYPVNAVYCHAAIWQTAFTELVKRTDVVLMDVRGFTSANRGCAWELEQLLQHTARPPIVLLVDSRTDLITLGDIVRKAGEVRDFTALDYGQRTKRQRRALFELLAQGAFSTAPAA